MNKKLLIVEDDADFAAALSRAMGKRGFETAVAHDAVEARSVATAFSPSHAVVDLKLPGESGLAVVAALAARTPAPAIVVLTGYASIATAVEAVRLGARHYRRNRRMPTRSSPRSCATSPMPRWKSVPSRYPWHGWNGNTSRRC